MGRPGDGRNTNIKHRARHKFKRPLRLFGIKRIVRTSRNTHKFQIGYAFLHYGHVDGNRPFNNFSCLHSRNRMVR